MWYIHFFGYFIVLMSVILQLFCTTYCGEMLLRCVTTNSSWKHILALCSGSFLKLLYQCLFWNNDTDNYFCYLPFYLVLQQMTQHLFICNFCYVHCMGRLMLHLLCTSPPKSDTKDSGPPKYKTENGGFCTASFKSCSSI